ncbi:RND family transporter [Acidobacteriota bacterium]
MKLLFRRIGEFSYDNSKVVLFFFAIILIPGIFFLKDLQTETDPLNINSLKGEVFKNFRDNYERFGDSSPLVILLQYAGVRREIVNRFTDRLAEELRLQQDIPLVTEKIFNLEDFSEAEALMKAALLNSPPDILEKFAEKFTLEGMEKEISWVRKGIVIAEDPSLRELLASDVLNIRGSLYPYFQYHKGNFFISESSVYFESNDYNSRLIFVYPSGSGGDTRYCVALLAHVETLVENLKQKILGAENIQCVFTGKYSITNEAARLLKRDLLRMNLVAASLILLLLMFVFRNLKVTLLCFLPIASSLIAALLVARFFFNPLKFLCIGFVAVLIGMGIDISFHLTSRYFLLRGTGKSQKEAVIFALVECGPPVSIGALTTAGAFGVLFFANFSNLVQWGALTAIGLFLMLGMTILLFPAFVKVINPKLTFKKTVGRLEIFPRLIYKPALSKSCWVVGTASILIVICIFIARNLSFEMEFMEFLPKRMESIDQAGEVSRIFGTSFLFNMQATLEAENLQSGMNNQRQLDVLLNRLVKEERIAGFTSPSLFIPYGEMTSSQRPFYELAAERLRKRREDFFRLLKKKGFREDSRYSEYYNLLEAVYDEDSESIMPAVEGDLPQNARRVFRKSDQIYYLQTYIWPLHDVHEYGVFMNTPGGLELFKASEGVDFYLTGTQEVFRTVLNMVKADFLRLSLWGFLTVGLILFSLFRNATRIYLCLLPLAGAIPFTLAFIVIGGISFSPFAIAIVAVIVGIGIDDAVHLVTRRFLTQAKPIEEILENIAPVLTLTTLSTMIGFGTLILSSNYLIRSIGAIIAFGVFMSWIFTFIFLPPLLRARFSKLFISNSKNSR